MIGVVATSKKVKIFISVSKFVKYGKFFPSTGDHFLMPQKPNLANYEINFVPKAHSTLTKYTFNSTYAGHILWKPSFGNDY